MISDSILLVDDDPVAIKVLGRILSHLGELRFAAGGKDALRLARESAPDLMLLDATMPGMSGFDVCCELRADPTLVDVPVIFVTSNSDPLSELSGFDLGAVDYIAKPFSAPLVVARVKAQLRMKRQVDELLRIATRSGVTDRRRLQELRGREWFSARKNLDPSETADD
jgi:DNA-binding response OmpR family regulator